MWVPAMPASPTMRTMRSNACAALPLLAMPTLSLRCVASPALLCHCPRCPHCPTIASYRGALSRRIASPALPGNASHGMHGFRCGTMGAMRAPIRGAPTIGGARWGRWGAARIVTPLCCIAVHGVTGQRIQRIRERVLLRNHHIGYIVLSGHSCDYMLSAAPEQLFVKAPGCSLLIAYCFGADGPGSRQRWPGH